MSLEFVHPHAGWLLLALPLVWLSAAKHTGWAHKMLRSGVFAALILGLAQPAFIGKDNGAYRVFVLDQSASLSPEAKARALEVLRQSLASVPRGDRAVLIQIGGEPVKVAVARRQQWDNPLSPSSLSQALQAALDAIPLGANGAIALITDGLSTDQHWQQALFALRQRGLPVNVLELGSAPQQPFIEAMTTPPVQAGQQATFTLALKGQGQGLGLSLYQGATEVKHLSDLTLTGEGELALSVPVKAPGFEAFHAELSDAQGQVLSRYNTLVAIQAPPNVLYLGQDAGGAAKLQALLGSSADVSTLAPSALLGVDWNHYRLVFMDDIAAKALPVTVQESLLDAVRDQGLGLVHTGGKSAFGPGGYAGQPLAKALPVTIDDEQQKKQPSISLAIVVDSSGSMQGKPIELAKQLARLAVRKLKPTDNIGVVEFYGNKQWSVPMQPAQNLDEIERAIGRMQAKGGSVLLPAIQEAYFGLRNTHTRYKHLLVITDAGVEEENYQRLMRHIAQEQINVSTALVGGSGEGEDKMMDWANWGHGRFYEVNDEFSMVQIDLNRPQSEPVAQYRQGQFAPTLAPGSWWQGNQTLPAITGYDKVSVRPRAQTLVSLDDGSPLVASWQYGAGRVSAMMTEPFGQGTQGWQSWAGYGRWLGSLLARTANQQWPFNATLSRQFDQLTIDVQKQLPGYAEPKLTRLTPQGAQDIALYEKAPGIYHGQLALPETEDAQLLLEGGASVLRLADRAGSDLAPEGEVAAAMPLEQLASLTGGQYSTSQLGQKVAKGSFAIRAITLWPWALLLALALYLTELMYRRWPRHRQAIAQDKN